MNRRRRVTLGAVGFTVVAAACFALAQVTGTYSLTSMLAGMATLGAIHLWMSR